MTIYYLQKDPKINKIKLTAIIGVILLVSMAISLFVAKESNWSLFKEDTKSFPVKGIQVSQEDGYLDWQGIESNQLSFAYIKATEGSNYTDDQFAINWERIQGTSLRRGASHYFSFDSPGATQGSHFNQVVSTQKGDLPSVVMVELYDQYKQNPPEKESVVKELKAFIQVVMDEKGQNLILCVDANVYQKFIKNEFVESDIWLVDTKNKPSKEEKIPWKFWEYTEEGELSKGNIKQQSLDFVVFNGNKSQFEKFGQ